MEPTFAAHRRQEPSSAGCQRADFDLGRAHARVLSLSAPLLLSLSSCVGSVGAPTSDSDENRRDNQSSREEAPSTQPPNSELPGGPPKNATNPTDSISGPAFLGCPTVPQAVSPSVQPGLSTKYQSLCAGCHNDDGSGRGDYPALPGRSGEGSMIDIVRSGKGGMPRFTAAQIPDEVLRADFAILAGRSLSTPGKVQAHPSSSWDAATIAQKLEVGRRAYRKPDHLGNACINCHSPDGIELAVIGFNDGDVTRRALDHVPWEDVPHLVDYVHALRRRLGITTPCDPLGWRPFQPAGAPLPGDTVAAQDAAFGRMLEERGYRVMTGRLDSVADAHAVAAELAGLDLKRLPIGINLPRWSEDPFHGEAHRSHNDWMTDLARVPVDGGWYRILDEYLQDPTDTHFATVLRAAAQATTLGKTDGPADASAYGGGRARGHVEATSLLKYVSVLIGTHLMRTHLSGDRDYLERGPYALSALTATATSIDRSGSDAPNNPFLDIGSTNAEGFCYNDGNCRENALKAVPTSAFEDLPFPKTDVTYTSSLSHPWFTLGQIFDQSLTSGVRLGFAEGFPFYWNVFQFPHADFHQPFFNAHKVFVDAKLIAETRADGGKAPPQKLVRLKRFIEDNATSLYLLHDFGQAMTVADMNWDKLTGPDLRRSYVLRAHIARTLLLLRSEALAQGKRWVDYNDGALSKESASFGELARELGKRLSDPAFARQQPELARDRRYWVDDLSALSNEVVQRLEAGHRLPCPAPNGAQQCFGF
jgi:mono/diheme cytochrome c family protein